MNWYLRGLVGVLLGVALCGAPGCSQDNETELQALNKGMGDPGAKNPNEKKAESVSNSPDARAERQKTSRIKRRRCRPGIIPRIDVGLASRSISGSEHIRFFVDVSTRPFMLSHIIVVCSFFCLTPEGNGHD